jgi:NADH-quinone oxidoreductase subunit B
VPIGPGCLKPRVCSHGTLRGNTVICVDVHYVNLACCGVEAGSLAAQHASRDLADVPGPNVVVVAGTVTAAAADIVADRVAAVPTPRLVVAYGVCTIAGGPYWDSYAVVPGIEADVLVPGCPPRPDALAAAVRDAVAVGR